MEANSTHISLETAKLLEGKLRIDNKWGYYSTAYDNYETYALSGNPAFWRGQPNYPAYTWQEILWEYPQEFFGEDAYDTFGGFYHTCRFAVDILDFLQDKEYDEADKYFKDNCILIK